MASNNTYCRESASGEGRAAPPRAASASGAPRRVAASRQPRLHVALPHRDSHVCLGAPPPLFHVGCPGRRVHGAAGSPRVAPQPRLPRKRKKPPASGIRRGVSLLRQRGLYVGRCRGTARQAVRQTHRVRRPSPLLFGNPLRVGNFPT